MSVESSKVHAWIAWGKDDVLEEVWDEPLRYRAFRCWQVLKAKRDNGESGESLACAEHYMFAFMAVAYGVPYAIMVFLVGAYQSAKAFGWIVDNFSPTGILLEKALHKSPSSVLRLGAGQLTAPSWDQLDWGEKGAADGRKVGSKGKTLYGAL